MAGNVPNSVTSKPTDAVFDKVEQEYIVVETVRRPVEDGFEIVTKKELLREENAAGEED